MRRVLLCGALLLIASEDTLEEVLRRDIFLLCAEDRRPIACRTAHTYILFTPTARPDLHNVHNRVIAAAFLTDHNDCLSVKFFLCISNNYRKFSSVNIIVFSIWTRSLATRVSEWNSPVTICMRSAASRVSTIPFWAR